MGKVVSERNRVAVVTGAGSGIGRAVAIELCRQGFSVALAGRRRERLEATAAAIAGSQTKTRVISTDVTNADSVKRLFAETISAFGRLDLLFNNAGVGAPSVPLEDVALEDWRSTLDTNLTGAFLCSQQAIGIMKRQSPQGGRIINNGSVSAQAPRPNSAPYTASKHALTGLTKSISLDGRRYNIVCGQIDVGNAATDFSAPIALGVPQADGGIRAEPTIDVGHVARAVGYMASLPLEANVLFLTVMASGMPLVGRG